ncbi:MAG: hypothetical protein H6607_05915 [Flavobacteriales bacterium]|nr:hypothetical protein [Flavobacteriales bacterium]
MKKILIALFVLGYMPLLGQNNMTLYNMKTVPQRFYANPATPSDAKVYIGFPFLTSNTIGAGFSSFVLKDVNDAMIKTDSGIIFDATEFSKSFKKDNKLFINYGMDLMCFGFKIPKGYLFVNSGIKTNTAVSFPGDLFAFLAQGNGGDNLDRTFNYGFKANLLSYVDLGLGLSLEPIKDKLRVGGRIRAIKGLYVLQTAKSDITFHTDPNTFDYTLASDIEINAANSFQSLAGLDLINGSNISVQTANVGDMVGSLFKPSNRGWGIDLGAQFKPTEKITLSGSVLNLGRIKWNKNNISWVSKNPGAQYRFEGIQMDDAFNYDKNQFETDKEELKDTLISIFNLTSNTNTFHTGLFGEFYLGANYNLLKNFDVGALFYGQVVNRSFYPAFTLSANTKLTNVFATSISYSVANNSFVNAGLGVSLNLGFLQFYLVSDNLLSVFWPTQVNTLSLRTGINITQGRKDREKKEKTKN